MTNGNIAVDRLVLLLLFAVTDHWQPTTGRSDGHPVDPNAKPTTKPDDEEGMGM